MSVRIEPALTAEEWAGRKVRFVGIPDVTFHDDGDGMELVVWAGDRVWEKLKFDLAPDVDLPALIALANSGLKDSDPRKITQAAIRSLRALVATTRRHPAPSPAERLSGSFDADAVEELADALSSYLPPEKGA